MEKDTILYFEDAPMVWKWAEIDLAEAFPEYKRVLGKEGDKKEVDKILNEIGGIEKIAIICTDGKLEGEEKLNYGWETINYLREKGYNGPAIYTGGTELPEKARTLYTVISKEKYGNILINHIKNSIQGLKTS